MLDIKELRKNKKIFEKKLKSKSPEIDLNKIFDLDDKYLKNLNELHQLKNRRNTISKEIGIKKRNNEDTEKEMSSMKDINNQIEMLQEKTRAAEKDLLDEASMLPNIPMDDVPISEDPNDNECKKVYDKKKEFSFHIKNHLELNEKLHLFDLKKSAIMTGSGWPLYTDKGAQLEWALINYMLDIHKKNGFKFILPPLLVNEKTMYNSGQLPKFNDQLFKINDKDYNLFLIPTSEVALNGLYWWDIIPEEKLPLKYVSYTPCFRREAGAAGKQERGLIRMHQFNKVELFCFTKPEDSPKVFDMMIESAEKVLEGLELHYRNMLLVTGDMSFGSAKTVDIEVWLPGQNRYYEVSSVSNCTDFQSRRSKIRFKSNNPRRNNLVHTLNGSGVATSRLLISLLENNQNEDGSVNIPEELQPYLDGMKVIEPD